MDDGKLFVQIFGRGLGDFLNNTHTEDYLYVCTRYEFSSWKGNQYYLRDRIWSLSTEGIVYCCGSALYRSDPNTMIAKVFIYFPIAHSDDGSTYEYEWGEFTFHVPVT